MAAEKNINLIGGLLSSIEVFFIEADFIEAIEDTSILAGWDEKQKLTVACLRLGGRTREWLRANPVVRTKYQSKFSK